MDSTSSYHLHELEISRDKTSPAHQNPPPVGRHARVLDIGCGAGQTLIAMYPDQVSFGVDIDLKALRLGATLTRNVRFVCARAEALPFRAGSFDLITARVSLPYTDIPKSLSEIHRLLKPGSLFWTMLHAASVPLERVGHAVRHLRIKGIIFFGYILLNSLWFQFKGDLFRFLNGQYESFQTERGMRTALEKAGFDSIQVQRNGWFLMTARRKRGDAERSL